MSVLQLSTVRYLRCRTDLYILDLVEEQLHEYGYDVLLADELPVEALPRQDVQRPDGALHDLLHAHAVRVGAARRAAARRAALLES